jgi:pre-rRNA-processing protein IPI3
MSSAGELFVSASSEEDGALRVWDAYTGAEKWKGKGSQSQSRTLCRIGDDVLASAPLGRSEIRFWSLSKSTTLPGSGRCSTWEPLLALAATPDGMYVVGGSKSGKLYIWEVASGNLLRFWDAHYSAVSVLAISDDGLAIVSAEEHAYIKVWQLGDCLDLSDDARARDPPAYRTWTEHSLPVTDLVLGVGGGACRVYSASLDHTVRIWCTATSDRLCSIRLPAKCTSLALEPAERELFVGGSDGVVYAISLAAGPPSPEWATEAETQDQRGAAGAAFRGHRGSITALATSSDGTLLLSASADTHVRVWDVPSRQTLRIFERHGGALTNLIPLGLHTSASFGERGALVVREGERERERERERPPHCVCGFSFILCCCSDLLSPPPLCVCHCVWACARVSAAGDVFRCRAARRRDRGRRQALPQGVGRRLRQRGEGKGGAGHLPGAAQDRGAVGAAGWQRADAARLGGRRGHRGRRGRAGLGLGVCRAGGELAGRHRPCTLWGGGRPLAAAPLRGGGGAGGGGWR